jgi:hypothetical protein
VDTAGVLAEDLEALAQRRLAVPAEFTLPAVEPGGDRDAVARLEVQISR